MSNTNKIPFSLFSICTVLCIFFAFGTWVLWGKIGDIKEEKYEQERQFEEMLTYIKDINKNIGEHINNISQYPSISSNISSSTVSTTSAQKPIVDLPSNIKLDVPFTSQAPEKNWDQPWQDACEEAALLMLDAYYKNYSLSVLFAKDELQKMVDWETDKGWGGSIEIEKVKQAGEWYMGNQRLRIVEKPTVDDIKRSLANNHPVLVVADGKVLPNPNFRNGGPLYHALVVTGYDEDEFITNDPGTQFGKDFRYKYDDLVNAIHDWNSGDVSSGRRVILVVE